MPAINISSKGTESVKTAANSAKDMIDNSWKSSSFTNYNSNSIQLPPKTSIKYGINSFDIWSLGITIVIGGQYFSWNAGLSAGVGSYGIAVLLTAVGYTALILNIAETTSGLPFTGGSYGLARCVLGNYWGFLLGCSETVEYIFYVAVAVLALEQMIEFLLPDVQHYPPVTCLLIYIFAVCIHIWGGRAFWTFNRFLGVISVLILLLFCFGSMAFVDFNKYAPWPSTAAAPVSNPWFVGDASDFMMVLPLASWLYLGIETLKETCNDLDEPKVQIPRGQISCVITLVLMSILVFFVSVALPPGIVSMATNAVPLNAGFQLMFGLSDQVTLQYATILSIPATFATVFGFIMMYGKIMSSMSQSCLMPTFLRVKHSRTGSPYITLIVGSTLSYFVCLISFWYTDLHLYIFNICMLASSISYSMQSICYMLLKLKYHNIECEYHSPIGVCGGVISLLVWLLVIIAIAGFQKDDNKALIAVLVLYAFFTVWYVTYAKYHQEFSQEEKDVFFKLYLINHHSLKASRQRFMRQASTQMLRRSEFVFLRDCFKRKRHQLRRVTPHPSKYYFAEHRQQLQHESVDPEHEHVHVEPETKGGENQNDDNNNNNDHDDSTNHHNHHDVDNDQYTVVKTMRKMSISLHNMGRALRWLSCMTPSACQWTPLASSQAKNKNKNRWAFNLTTLRRRPMYCFIGAAAD